MLSKEQLQTSLRADPQNISGIRNIRNTPKEAYNCGGFALSIYDWICPYYRTDHDGTEDENWDYTTDQGWLYTDYERDELMQDYADNGYDASDIEAEILQYDVAYLLNTYPFLEVTKLEDCAPSDTVIAYRLFVHVDEDECVDDTDFHFKIRINGFWFEKMGDGDVKLCSLDADKSWLAPTAEYTSRIVYFKTAREFKYETE